MRWKIIAIQGLVILALGGICFGAYNKINSLREEISAAYTNIKAYAAENDSLTNEKRAFKFTIEELKSSKDSINRKLLEVQKKLKIRDKDVRYLEYQLSIASKKDTVILRDTIFQPDVKIDTTIRDKWYSLRLGLEYPNKVVVEPKFRSERTVVGHLQKETIKPPKKFFLCRWFQRKHKVLLVDVVEESPYIYSETERYIQVIE
nr:MAG TPA: hypothetical protein [Crassvirales sp.]